MMRVCFTLKKRKKESLEVLEGGGRGGGRNERSEIERKREN